MGDAKRRKVVLMESPVKLAFRQEGDFWNAYLADRNSMRDSVLIGSINIRVVSENEHLKDAFMDLMQKSTEHMLKTAVGVSVQGWKEPQQVPESERSGNA